MNFQKRLFVTRTAIHFVHYENFRKLFLHSLIQYFFPPLSVKSLWGQVHEAKESEFTANEKEMFHKGLERHHLSVYGIDFGKLTLFQVTLPVLQVSTNYLLLGACFLLWR